MSLGGGKVNQGSGEVELKRVKAKGRGLNLFFFSGGPKDAAQPGKKRGKLGGVSEGKVEKPHYA